MVLQNFRRPDRSLFFRMREVSSEQKVQLEEAVETKKNFLDEFDALEKLMKNVDKDADKLASEKFSLKAEEQNEDKVNKAKVLFV